MDKFKVTIYLPLGYQNSNISSEQLLNRYIQKEMPKEFRVTQVIDRYIEQNSSAITVEVEKAEDSINTEWLVNHLETRITEAKSNRLKQELRELISEITAKSKL